MHPYRLLDLFAGAQGAGVGYARAGFQVTAVDIEPHDKHPEITEFIQADALDVLTDRGLLDGFDVVHASPPCQAYTTMSNRNRGDWPDLLSAVRHGLKRWGGTYVIENVPGARRHMDHPILLHGGMFDLGVDRPRLFESNTPLMPYRAPKVNDPIGVYGKLDGRRLFTRADGTEQRNPRSLTEAQAAMGIDWMSWDDLREAIPPAYTQYVGEQLLDHLRNDAAAEWQVSW